MLVVETDLRGVVDFGEYEEVCVVELADAGVLVEYVLGVDEVVLGSECVFVVVRSEDE